jgi:hypothetical protein
VHAPHFDILPGTRQIFVVAVDSLQTSCGWGVPFMQFERERETLMKFHAQNETAERLAKISKRTTSIDGLPVRQQDRFPAR